MPSDPVPARVRAAIDAAWRTNGWHDCPGCGGPAAPGSVGCPSCWLALPVATRQRLSAAFRLRLSDPGTYRAACDETACLMAKEGD
jgi:hypothetical protein